MRLLGLRVACFATIGAWIGVVPGPVPGPGPGTASGAVIHDEAVDGDLSNDRLNPTAHTLALGVNSLIATSVSGDREYVRLSVPAGLRLDSLVLFSYVGQDLTAFIGVQGGTTFTEPPTGTNTANLLGYSHFGPGPGNVGADILPAIGTGFGAIGFVPPLASGEYTWWIQQTGASAATYRFDYVVGAVPAPGAGVVCGAVAMCGGARRLRRETARR